MVKVRNVIYDKKLLQEAVSQETTIGLHMEEETAVLEHLNFFNKIISEFLTVDVKIDEEDKALVLLSLLPQSYDHIVTNMLCGKKNSYLGEGHVNSLI